MSIGSIGRAVRLIGAIALASLLSSSSAAAQQVTASAASSAISGKLRSLQSDIASGYFQTNVSSVVVSSTGAYQNFRGSKGRGAIYWSPSTQARAMYGDILSFYTNNGMEEEIGYPSTDPLSGSGASYGCANGTNVFQTFSRISVAIPGKPIPRQMQTLCADARGRVTVGQVTFSGAGTPVVTGVSRGNDQGRSNVAAYEDEYWDEDEDEDDDWAQPARPAAGSSGSRAPSSSGSRGSSGVLTPR